MKSNILRTLALLLVFCGLAFTPDLGVGQQMFPISGGTALPLAKTSGGTGSASTALNFADPLLLPHWRAAVASVKLNVANTHVIFIGDSTTIGSSAAGAAQFPSFPSWVARKLTAAGIPATENSWFGNGNGIGSLGNIWQLDTRISYGSWVNQGLYTLGGGVGAATSAANGTFTYNATAQTDTCVTYAVCASGNATISAQLGSGTVVNLNESTCSGVPGLSATTTLGTNACKVNWISGGTGYIIGQESFNSAVKEVSVINGGWFGSTSTNWNDGTGNFFNTTATIQALAPSLCVITADINDANTGVPVATFIANIQAVINACQVSGDVLLVTDNPTTVANQPTYAAALMGLAANDNIARIDQQARWVSYAYSNAFGYFVDVYHPAPKGAEDLAAPIAQYLIQAVGAI